MGGRGTCHALRVSEATAERRVTIIYKGSIMEIICSACKVKNIISNRFCYKCGKELRNKREGELSYDSVEDFLATLKDSSYYEKRMEAKRQNRFILNIIIALILLFLFTAGGFLFLLPKILIWIFR